MPVDTLNLVALYVLVLLAAILYSSGGHAGASAYLAIMALCGFLPAAMRPTALAMNIAVATVGSIRFSAARAVPWRLLLPLVAGSVPLAFVGGRIRLSMSTYVLILGSVLLVSAGFLWLRPAAGRQAKPPRPGLLVLIGCGLGFISGLTGIGGGIFLSPILILTGWADPRLTSGAAAVFILLNSILGLAGQASTMVQIPSGALFLAATAVCGGLVGSWLGVNRFKPLTLRRVHSVVLVVSGVKLVLDGLKGFGG